MRVLIVPNVANSAAVAMAAEVATWIAAAGADPVLEMSDATACDLMDFGVERFEIDDPGLVVSLGGDGTILKAVHLIGDVDTPILGINMGRLGFLTAVGPADARRALVDALAGDVRLERRTTARATATTAEGIVEWRALNEVFVGRADHARMVRLRLGIDGVPVGEFGADGVIVATATGSTAYAMSAGGPIVAPSYGGLVVVSVAPHTLHNRPIVTGPSDTVEIALESTRPDACVTVDGTFKPCPLPIEHVRVTRDDTDVVLVRLDGDGFYEAMAATFFGG